MNASQPHPRPRQALDVVGSSDKQIKQDDRPRSFVDRVQSLKLGPDVLDRVDILKSSAGPPPGFTSHTRNEPPQNPLLGVQIRTAGQDSSLFFLEFLERGVPLFLAGICLQRGHCAVANYSIALGNQQGRGLGSQAQREIDISCCPRTTA